MFNSKNDGDLNKKYTMRLIRKIKRVFITPPQQEFQWSPEEFNRAKKWAKSQDDPDNPNKSLWDRVYSPRLESEEILHELNKFI